MKRLLLIVWAVFLILPLFASSGDTLNIGGVVPLILNLTVAPDANCDNLDLVDAAGPTSVTPTIAAITIETNNSGGWELWIMSNNADTTACALINDDGDQVAYTLTYTGTGGVTSAVTATTGTMYGEADSGAGAARYDDTGNLVINYDQEADNPSGYYADQLTIVLRAK